MAKCKFCGAEVVVGETCKYCGSKYLLWRGYKENS